LWLLGMITVIIQFMQHQPMAQPGPLRLP
jgi:uncharacterized membrane protein YdbT with pleckstrin-like domain